MNVSYPLSDLAIYFERESDSSNWQFYKLSQGDHSLEGPLKTNEMRLVLCLLRLEIVKHMPRFDTSQPVVFHEHDSPWIKSLPDALRDKRPQNLARLFIWLDKTQLRQELKLHRSKLGASITFPASFPRVIVHHRTKYLQFHESLPTEIEEIFRHLTRPECREETFESSHEEIFRHLTPPECREQTCESSHVEMIADHLRDSQLNPLLAIDVLRAFTQSPQTELEKLNTAGALGKHISQLETNKLEWQDDAERVILEALRETTQAQSDGAIWRLRFAVVCGFDRRAASAVRCMYQVAIIWMRQASILASHNHSDAKSRMARAKQQLELLLDYSEQLRQSNPDLLASIAHQLFRYAERQILINSGAPDIIALVRSQVPINDDDRTLLQSLENAESVFRQLPQQGKRLGFTLRRKGEWLFFLREYMKSSLCFAESVNLFELAHNSYDVDETLKLWSALLDTLPSILRDTIANTAPDVLVSAPSRRLVETLTNDLSANYPPLVGTNESNTKAFPISFAEAHRDGIPHRGVHLEIVDNDRLLVFRRADGRMEIPGGHLDWNESRQQPEGYEEAGLRECCEELALEHNWNMTQANVIARIRPHMKLIRTVWNELPSSHGKNREWIGVLRLTWQADWGDVCNFNIASSHEGNTEPFWISRTILCLHAQNEPTKVNAAVKLLLQRENEL